MSERKRKTATKLFVAGDVSDVNTTKSQKLGEKSMSVTHESNYGLVERTKVFNDVIHSNIKLGGICLKIVDTPEFQRMHYLKQLGTADFVFRCATHTRFEHSLGVSYLAEKMCNVLKSNQSILGITDNDVLCVKVAALCHDLGHGPFSHVFDGVFIKNMYPNGIDQKGKKWRHEDGSVMMFHHLLKTNNITVTDYGLSDIDLVFICEIIGGVPEPARRGRPPSKFFLYDIVNNMRSGLDVDKLDYFQRDMKAANVFTMAGTVAIQRFIELGKVLPAEPIRLTTGARPALTPPHSPAASAGAGGTGGSGSDTEVDEEDEETLEDAQLPLMICYPEKMIAESLDLFATRYHMHQEVYTHKAGKQVEYMIMDVLEAADPYVKIRGAVTDKHTDGLYSMSETIFDMTAFANLKDSVLDIIMNDSNPNLARAQMLIKRIMSRQLYTCVGETSYRNEDDHTATTSELNIKLEMLELCKDMQSTGVCVGGGCRDSPARSAKAPIPIPQSPYTHHTSADSASIPVLAQDHHRKKLTASSRSKSFTKDIVPIVRTASVTAVDTNNTAVLLEADDLIVEKMHIHYGLKGHNPVSRMRFFPKSIQMGSALIGKEINENAYQEMLPRSFEKCALRVFSRYPHKEALVRQSFEMYCAKHCMIQPLNK